MVSGALRARSSAVFQFDFFKKLVKASEARQARRALLQVEDVYSEWEWIGCGRVWGNACFFALIHTLRKDVHKLSTPTRPLVGVENGLCANGALSIWRKSCVALTTWLQFWLACWGTEVDLDYVTKVH